MTTFFAALKSSHTTVPHGIGHPWLAHQCCPAVARHALSPVKGFVGVLAVPNQQIDVITHSAHSSLPSPPALGAQHLPNSLLGRQRGFPCRPVVVLPTLLGCWLSWRAAIPTTAPATVAPSCATTRTTRSTSCISPFCHLASPCPVFCCRSSRDGQPQPERAAYADKPRR